MDIKDLEGIDLDNVATPEEAARGERWLPGPGYFKKRLIALDVASRGIPGMKETYRALLGNLGASIASEDIMRQLYAWAEKLEKLDEEAIRLGWWADRESYAAVCDNASGVLMEWLEDRDVRPASRHAAWVVLAKAATIGVPVCWALPWAAYEDLARVVKTMTTDDVSVFLLKFEEEIVGLAAERVTSVLGSSEQKVLAWYALAEAIENYKVGKWMSAQALATNCLSDGFHSLSRATTGKGYVAWVAKNIKGHKDGVPDPDIVTVLTSAASVQVSGGVKPRISSFNRNLTAHYVREPHYTRGNALHSIVAAGELLSLAYPPTV